MHLLVTVRTQNNTMKKYYYKCDQPCSAKCRPTLILVNRSFHSYGVTWAPEPNETFVKSFLSDLIRYSFPLKENEREQKFKGSLAKQGLNGYIYKVGSGCGGLVFGHHRTELQGEAKMFHLQNVYVLGKLVYSG